MKRFFIQLAKYIVLIYLVNLAVGLALKKLGPEYADSPYGQVKWEDFREIPSDSLDILFLGSSHFLSGIDPAVVDSVTTQNSYNMARVGLRPASAYILLNEVLDKQKPKFVVLDIFHRTFTGSGFNHLYDFGYVDFEQSKVSFAKENFSLEENARLFFPTYIYRSNLPNIRPLLGFRSQKDNWQDLHYKGYIRHNATISQKKLQENEFVNYQFDQLQIDPKNLLYLDKLVSLCRENDIEMIWVTTPLPEICLAGIKNQAEIDAYFQALADKYGIKYLNYNETQLRKSVSFADSVDYSDDDHLNFRGAKKISADIAQRIESQLSIDDITNR